MLCTRAFLGPFDWTVLHVHSPLPAEGFVSVSVLALLLVGGSRMVPARVDKIVAPSLQVLPLALALCLITLAFCWNLNDPFLSDDYILVGRASWDANRIAASFHTPGGDGAFRPIGTLYFDVVGMWARQDPWRWHICGLGLHLLTCALIYYLVWILWLNPLNAFAAAMLFGLHGTRPEVVTWTAGSFDLLAACFGLSALVCAFQHARRLPFFALIVANLCSALAILSKESAYALPAFVLGLGIASGRFHDPKVRRAFASTAITCTAMFVYRWTLFHGPGGYIDPKTGRPAILSLTLVSTFKALSVRMWSILMFPLNWEAHEDKLLLFAVPLTCMVFLYLAYTGTYHSRRTVGVLLATTVVAMLPAIHLALIGEDALGSRILYFPSLGFCLMGAHALSMMQPRVARNLALFAVILCSGVGLAHNLEAWHQTAAIADRTCAAASAQPSVEARPMPRAIHGVFFFANGFPECIAMKRGRTMKQ